MLLCSTAVACATLLGGVVAAPAPKAMSEPVLRVNGYPMTKAEVLDIVRARLTRLHMVGPHKNKKLREQLRQRCVQQALSAIVVSGIVRAECARRGLEAGEADLTAAKQADRRRFPTEAAWKEDLSRRGQTEASFEQNLRQRIREKLLRKAICREPPTEAEAQAYYQAHRDRFVDHALDGRTRPLRFEECAASCRMGALARKRTHGYDDWLRQALSAAEIEVLTPTVQDSATGVRIPLSELQKRPAAATQE